MTEIITIPDERLKKRSAAVPRVDGYVFAAAKKLNGILDGIGHAVGVAAPQTGDSIRIIAVDASKSRRPCRNRGRMILVNPEIVSSSGRIIFREGCMSLPGIQGYVERAGDIKVRAVALSPDSLRDFTEDGSARPPAALKARPVTFRSSGFEAVVIQHEIDHLDGILFIDRVKRI